MITLPMISTLSSNPSLLRETTLPPACREHSMGPLFPKASLHLWILLILCDGCLVSQMKLKVKGRLHGTKGGFFMVEAKKQLGRLKQSALLMTRRNCWEQEQWTLFVEVSWLFSFQVYQLEQILPNVLSLQVLKFCAPALWISLRA